MRQEKLITYVNRKEWWHVPPQDPHAYAKRGKFLASSFREAEFWGRPLDQPQHVSIANPLVGDEETIERELFGKRMSEGWDEREGSVVEARWALDAKIKKAAEAKGYDSIMLMSPRGLAQYRAAGKLPRSLELNVFGDYRKRAI